MEIERKFLPKECPLNLDKYQCVLIEQAYLNTDPVVRVRKQDDEYILTYKGKGMLAREEYNLPLNEKSYLHLLNKADGNVITKRRYKIPLENNLVAELDIFENSFKGLVILEVEFSSIEDANAFEAPEWFGEDVTNNPIYANSYLSRMKK